MQNLTAEEESVLVKLAILFTGGIRGWIFVGVQRSLMTYLSRSLDSLK